MGEDIYSSYILVGEVNCFTQKTPSKLGDEMLEKTQCIVYTLHMLWFYTVRMLKCKKVGNLNLTFLKCRSKKCSFKVLKWKMYLCESVYSKNCTLRARVSRCVKVGHSGQAECLLSWALGRSHKLQGGLGGPVINTAHTGSSGQTLYLSLASLARLVEKKFAIWGNFSFPCMTIVEKSKISPRVE